MARFSRNDYAPATSAVTDFMTVVTFGSVALASFFGLTTLFVMLRGFVLVQLWK